MPKKLYNNNNIKKKGNMLFLERGLTWEVH